MGSWREVGRRIGYAVLAAGEVLGVLVGVGVLALLLGSALGVLDAAVGGAVHWLFGSGGVD